MDRNEARKAAEVMLAYADGKEIEWKDKNSSSKWVPNERIYFNWEINDYRVKPESKYRPFKDAEECWQEMQKHQPFGWIQDIRSSKFKSYILSVDNEGVLIADYDDGAIFISYPSLLISYTFINGSLIGKK